MLKFSLKRDADTNKPVGLIITYGVKCSRCGYCGKWPECKYSRRSKIRNALLSIYTFLDFHFDIEAYHLLDIYKEYKNLSGTKKCPYNIPKIFCCEDCICYSEAGTCNHPDEKVRDRANKRKKGVICEHFKTI